MKIFLWISFIAFMAITPSCGQTIDEILGASSGDKSFDGPGGAVGRPGYLPDPVDYGTTIVEFDIVEYATPVRKKRAAMRDGRAYWRNNIVPYEIDSVHFDSGEIQEIRNSIDDWERFTCLDFREGRTSPSSRNYIKFTSSFNRGCSSPVGSNHLRGIENKISLEQPGCRQKYVISHEIGHSLGLWHEQSRPDRDEYVEVIWGEIKDGKEHNFQIKTTGQVNSHSIPYDYRSLMHYGRAFFAKNRGTTTLRTRDPAFQDIIGTARQLSFSDIKAINLMYDCKGSCASRDCPEDGFVGKDCQCWCPSANNVYRICGGPVIVECDPPATPRNGAMSGNNFREGGVVTFTCNSGYRLNGASRITCGSNEQWSSPPPTCQSDCGQAIVQSSPSEPGRSVTSPNYPDEYVNHLDCTWTFRPLQGYRLILRFTDFALERDDTCDYDYVQIQGTKYCGTNGPGEVSSASEVQLVFVTDLSITDTGFRLTYSFVSDGPVTCSNPGVPIFGRRDGLDFSVGSVVTFTCNPGFILSGPSSLSCGNNGQWSDSRPTCLACGTGCPQPACPIPAPLTNGRVIGTQPYSVGSVIQFTCNSGYQLRGASSSSCMAITDVPRWNPQPPTCERVSVTCPTPQLTNGQVIGTPPYSVGSVIQFTCNAGQQMSGASTSACIDISDVPQWYPQLPTCGGGTPCVDLLSYCSTFSSQCQDTVVRTACPRTCGTCSTGGPSCFAPNVANGQVTGTGPYAPGSFVTVVCNPGYRLQGSSVLRCTVSPNDLISWNPQPPSCIVDGCPPAQTITNGQAISSGTTVGSTIQYYCNSGFQLRGQSIRICSSSGQWSGSMPTCEGASCREPGTPQNGNKVGTTYTVGSVVTFTCNFNYVLQGPTTIFCLPSLQWSEPRPTCQDTGGNGIQVFQCDFEIGFCGFQLVLFSSPAAQWQLSRSQDVSDQVASIRQDNYFVRGHLQSPQFSPQEHCLRFSVFITDFQQGSLTVRDQAYRPLWSSYNAIPAGNWQSINVAIPSTATSIYFVGINYYVTTGHISIDDVELRTGTCQDGGICSDPGAPANGRKTDSRHFYPAGSVLNFVCNSGYDLQGSASTRCLSTGGWSDPLPTCAGASIRCDFEINMCGFSALSTGGSVWTLSRNSQLGSGQWAYIDQYSGYTRSTLQSPFFNQGGYCLRFRAMVSNTQVGSVEVKDNFFQTIWTSQNDFTFSSGAWNQISQNIGASVNQISFGAINNGYNSGQIAIDDIMLTSGSCVQRAGYDGSNSGNVGSDDVICNDQQACQREYGFQTIQYIQLPQSPNCCLRPLRAPGAGPSPVVPVPGPNPAPVPPPPTVPGPAPAPAPGPAPVPPPPTGGGCQDIWPNCADYPNDCGNSYMAQNCQGFCGCIGKRRKRDVGTALMGDETNAENGGGCQDIWPNCAEYPIDCGVLYMAQHCQRTCGCNGKRRKPDVHTEDNENKIKMDRNCTDTDEKCTAWAADGRCRVSALVQQSCPLSCQTCGIKTQP